MDRLYKKTMPGRSVKGDIAPQWTTRSPPYGIVTSFQQYYIYPFPCPSRTRSERDAMPIPPVNNSKKTHYSAVTPVSLRSSVPATTFCKTTDSFSVRIPRILRLSRQQSKSVHSLLSLLRRRLSTH